MTTSAIYPYIVSVHRPGQSTVCLGFTYAHQAEHASWSLADDLRNTTHIEGTTITWSATPAGLEPEAMLPTDPAAIAELIDREDDDLPMGHAFPDLYSRLKAQQGYEEATQIWRTACHWLTYVDREDDVEVVVQQARPDRDAHLGQIFAALDEEERKGT
jgi:hypothetical protein